MNSNYRLLSLIVHGLVLVLAGFATPLVAQVAEIDIVTQGSAGDTSQAEVEWYPPGDLPIAEFRLLLSDSGGGSQDWTFPSATLSYTLTALDPALTYEVQVVGLDAQGQAFCSSPTETIEVWTEPNPPSMPSPPPSMPPLPPMNPGPPDANLLTCDSQNFPFVYVTMTVDVDGNPVSGLVEENFQCTENGIPQEDFFNVDEEGETLGRQADFVILIDTSGSMGGEIAAVRNNINALVAAFETSDVDFRLGLVKFGNSSGANPFVYNGGILTDDISQYQGWVNGLTARGGYEPGLYAIQLAIQSFTFRPGSQIHFLLITDEDSDAGGLLDTINLAMANDVVVHVAAQCGFGSSNAHYCRDCDPLTDPLSSCSIRGATGGLLFGLYDPFNPDIIDAIVERIISRYIVRYSSNNPVCDGVERFVECTVTTEPGMSDTVSCSYIPCAAPIIIRTPDTIALSDTPQVEGVPLPIVVEVTDSSAPFVQEVVLFYRTTGGGSYQQLVMTNIGGDLYQADIPAGFVLTPGVDYYVSATDGVTTSFSPTTDPGLDPHQIAVFPNVPPLIVHTPVTVALAATPVTIDAQITDSTSSLVSTTLYWRRTGTFLYSSVEMTPTGGDNFQAVIPAVDVTPDGVDYYIGATDDYGVSSYEGTADVPLHITVYTDADLRIEKTSTANPAIAGTQIDYIVTVTNDGPADAINVQVSDPLPAGLTAIATSGCLNDPGGVPTCSLGDIPAGQSEQFTITVAVDASFLGPLSNTASVTSDTVDLDLSDNSVTEEILVDADADLWIEKTDMPDPVIAGTTLTYTVTVGNAGPSDALNVQVTDTLPAGVSFVSTSGCAEDPNGVPICSLGTILAGASKQYTIAVMVNSDTLGLITNTATVSSDTNDSNPANNTTSEDTQVGGDADLSIEKTDMPDPVVAGTTLTYTLTVSNSGPSDALTVQVTDTLPAGVSFVSTSGCAEDPNGVPVCSLGTILAGGSKQYTITVMVDSDTLGLITNTAAVNSDTPDSNPANNTTSEDTEVRSDADLSIEKTDMPDPVVAGTTLTYTVTVNNAGPSDALNVQVTDTLPAGVSFVSTSGCTEDPNGVPTCSLGTILASGSKQYTIAVMVDSDTLGLITNTATVSSDTPDSNPANDTTSEDTEVLSEADLSIEKIDMPDPVVAGTTLTYTVTVNNAGPSDALNVQVTDNLPAGVSFVSTSGCAEDPNGVPTCSLGTIPTGGSKQYTITVMVDSDTLGLITNTATVSSDTDDSNLANNTTTEETTVESLADLAIEKTDMPDPVIAGTTLSYTVTVTNNGPSDALNVQVTDTLPAGVSAASTAGCMNDPGGLPTCDLGVIPAGGSKQYTIEVMVDSDTLGLITNTAEVTSDTPDDNLSNNLTSEETTVESLADLTLAKSDMPDPVLAGTALMYSVSVTNNGPSDALNVQVTDTLPAGVSAATTAGCMNDPAGVPTCDLGTIPAGGTKQYTITVMVDSATLGLITNTAMVTSDTADENLGDNTASEQTTVEAEADLGLTKTDDPDPAVAGQDTITYTMTVNNIGPSDALNVQVTDTLPAGLTFQATSGCTEDPNGLPTCSLGTIVAGSSKQYTITASVDPSTLGTITNTATVDSDTEDPNDTNNTATEDTLIEALADLSIGKIDMADPVIAGDPLSYTITVTNHGPSDALAVDVTDTLPAGVTFVSTDGCTNDPNGVATCSLGGLPIGQSVEYTIDVTVDPGTFGMITNTAEVDSMTPDPDSGNNTASADTLIIECRLDVTKTCCIVPPPPIGRESDCDGDITSLTLEYMGGGCDATTNYQDGKFSCEGAAVPPEPVQVLVTDDRGDRVYADVTTVFFGDTIMVEAMAGGEDKLKSSTLVTITGMDSSEIVKFHTSCSKPIKVEDRFGSMRVVEITSEDGGTVTYTPPDPDASACIPLPPPPPPHCDGYATQAIFEYTGGTCEAAVNTQGDSAECEGYLDGDQPVSIVVTKDADDVTVAPSTEIMVGMPVAFMATDDKLKSSLEFDVMVAGEVMQSLKIHTSCSKPLNVGDEFGSMLLTSLTSTEGGTIVLPPSEPPEPTSECEIPAPMPFGCDAKISSLSLRYLGGSCEETTNTQEGKFECMDYGYVEPVEPVRIIVTDDCNGDDEGSDEPGLGDGIFLDTGDPADVPFGGIEEATAGNAGESHLPSESCIQIYDEFGNLIQEMAVHTSCSKPIDVGDRFGALEVFGLTGEDGQGTSLGATIEYTYTLYNDANTMVTDVDVTDDQLGPITESPLEIGGFETTVLRELAFIAVDTPNTATAGYLEADQVCPVSRDSAMVTLEELPDTRVCGTKVQAMQLRYTGPALAGPVEVLIQADKFRNDSVVYYLPDGLMPDDELVSGDENGYTVDATVYDKTELGSKTRIYINGVEEVLHTSCSTPFVMPAPAPLNEPKGAPSSTWFVVRFREK